MFTINHPPFFPFMCAFALLLVNSAIAANLAQSRAFGISQICNGSIACSLINANWPTDKEFTCGNETVSSTSFASAYPYMMMGQGTSMVNSSATWPSSVTSECQNSTAAEQYEYNNGVWNAYYSIVANCGCTGTGENALPNCTAATSQSSAACNVAMLSSIPLKVYLFPRKIHTNIFSNVRFTFCALEMNDVVCTYT